MDCASSSWISRTEVRASSWKRWLIARTCIASALCQSADAMRVDVTIGVPQPDKVDKQAVLAVLPHGSGTVTVVEGGLEIMNDAGTGSTVMANCAAIVHLDV